MKTCLGKDLIATVDLEKWSTKRLLGYYMSYKETIRYYTSRGDYKIKDSEIRIQCDELESYLKELKNILDKREHLV